MRELSSAKRARRRFDVMPEMRRFRLMSLLHLDLTLREIAKLGIPFDVVKAASASKHGRTLPPGRPPK